MRYKVLAVKALLFGEFRISLWRTIRARQGGRVLVSSKFLLKGSHRIHVVPRGRLYLGTSFFGFIDRRVQSLLRVRGRLDVAGSVRVGRGARWDIDEGAIVRLGDGTYFSPNTTLISQYGVEIGDACAIGWGVTLLDSSFHRVSEKEPGSVSGKTPALPTIRIGDHVWIGSDAKILPGVSIADGCVVASNSVVTRSFDEECCLIAGVPARIIRNNVSWA